MVSLHKVETANAVSASDSRSAMAEAGQSKTDFAKANPPQAFAADNWLFVQKMVDLRKSKAITRRFTF